MGHKTSRVLNCDLTAWMRGRNWRGFRFEELFGYHQLQWVLRELRAILAANAPLAEGLLVASKDAPSRKVRTLLERMATHLAEGRTLAASMRQLRRSFPQQVIDLVAAGESVGNPGWGVEQALRRLDRFYGEDAESLSALWGYPMAMPGFAVVAVGIPMVIGPEFFAILMDFGIPPTRFPIDIPWQLPAPFSYSDGLTVAALISVLLAVGALLVLIFAISGIGRVTKSVLRVIPGPRGWLKLTELSLVARILGQLLHARVPMDEALDTAAHSGDISRWLRRTLIRARDRVRQGEPLSKSLRDASRRLPRSAGAMAALGEDARDLPSALDYLADVWYERSRTRLAVLVELQAYVAVAGMAVSAFIITYELFASLWSIANLLSQPSW